MITFGAYKLTKNNYYLQNDSKIDSYHETDNYAKELITTMILNVFKSLFQVLKSNFNYQSMFDFVVNLCYILNIVEKPTKIVFIHYIVNINYLYTQTQKIVILNWFKLFFIQVVKKRKD